MPSSEEPRTAEAWFDRGRALDEAGDESRAVDAFDRCAELARAQGDLRLVRAAEHAAVVALAEVERDDEARTRSVAFLRQHDRDAPRDEADTMSAAGFRAAALGAVGGQDLVDVMDTLIARYLADDEIEGQVDQVTALLEGAFALGAAGDPKAGRARAKQAVALVATATDPERREAHANALAAAAYLSAEGGPRSDVLFYCSELLTGFDPEEGEGIARQLAWADDVIDSMLPGRRRALWSRIIGFPRKTPRR